MREEEEGEKDEESSRYVGRAPGMWEGFRDMKGGLEGRRGIHCYY